jgi:hypothetical protein
VAFLARAVQHNLMSKNTHCFCCASVVMLVGGQAHEHEGSGARDVSGDKRRGEWSVKTRLGLAEVRGDGCVEQMPLRAW